MNSNAHGGGRFSDFTRRDWFDVGLAALADLGLLAYPLAVAPTFRKMFADFGGTLPWLVSFLVSPWASALLSLIPFASLVAALAFPVSPYARRWIVVASALGAFALAGLFIAAILWPMPRGEL
ncbi:MAG: hypothetical protein QM765_07700 [Myxococcales bacterium]